MRPLSRIYSHLHWNTNICRRPPSSLDLWARQYGFSFNSSSYPLQWYTYKPIQLQFNYSRGINCIGCQGRPPSRIIHVHPSSLSRSLSFSLEYSHSRAFILLSNHSNLPYKTPFIIHPAEGQLRFAISYISSYCIPFVFRFSYILPLYYASSLCLKQ